MPRRGILLFYFIIVLILELRVFRRGTLLICPAPKELDLDLDRALDFDPGFDLGLIDVCRGRREARFSTYFSYFTAVLRTVQIINNSVGTVLQVVRLVLWQVGTTSSAYLL